MVPRQLRRRESLWMRNIRRKAGSLPSVQPDGVQTDRDWDILDSNRTSRSGGGALAYRNGTP